MINILYKYYARIFGRNFLLPFHRALFGLSLRGMGIMNYYDSYTSGEVSLLKRLKALGTIGIAVDIGANEGEYTKLLLKHLAPQNIYCIEAHPLTFNRLKNLESIKAGGVRLYQYAITDGSQEHIELFDYDGLGSSQASVIPAVSETFFAKPANIVTVPAISIDEVVDGWGIEKIGFLKIDIEGGEYAALVGAKNLLANQAVDYIQFEFNEMNILSGAHMKDFISLLADYDLYRLLPKGMVPIENYSPRLHEIYAYQNILAVRRGMPI
jgi:FkbM family methyltransferase